MPLGRGRRIKIHLMSDYGYTEEITYAIRELVSARIPFDIEEVRSAVEKILKDIGTYKDPVTTAKIKFELITLFERGAMPGYSMVLKPMVGDNGPYSILEFTPGTPLNMYHIIPIDIDGDSHKLTCRLPTYHKELIKQLADLNYCSQDMIARAILVRCLELIVDQLK